MSQSDRYAVVGDPISHSLSPVMHAAAFASAGLPARYDAIRVSAQELPVWMMTFARSELRGFNVTIPHKESICTLVDDIDESASAIGAINTVVTGQRLKGYNTDVIGFARTVRSLAVDMRGESAIVMGAGGSARAIIYALLSMGARITIVNRTLSKAVALAAQFPGLAQTCTPADMPNLAPARLLVNTTSLGMAHQPVSPLPAGFQLDRHTAVVDLVYGHVTPLMRAALDAGCTAVDGIEMLVQQGATSFRLWAGIEPDVNIMRSACRAALMEVATCSAS